MKLKSSNHSKRQTSFVKLNTGKCQACWLCVENCPNKVFSKINMLWHKHAKIAEPTKCSGCLACVEMCNNGAFSELTLKVIK